MEKKSLYKITFLMSDTYYIEATTEKEAEKEARGRLGCDYLIDDVDIELQYTKVEIYTALAAYQFGKRIAISTNSRNKWELPKPCENGSYAQIKSTFYNALPQDEGNIEFYILP